MTASHVYLNAVSAHSALGVNAAALRARIFAAADPQPVPVLNARLPRGEIAAAVAARVAELLAARAVSA